MKIIDRYLLLQFFRVFVMMFLSLLGIFIVADFVGNLTEFVDHGKETQSLSQVLIKYYGARVPWFFELAGRNVALLSAVLALGWMQRDNEMTALMAAGISRWRIAKPLILASILVALAGAVNRELGVPAFRRELCRNAQDLIRNRPDKLTPHYDPASDILFDGQAIYPREQRIAEPRFTLPRTWHGVGRKLCAESATFQAANGHRPAGYLLEGVDAASPLAELPSLVLQNRPVILTPHDQPWLQADQAFVVSNVALEQLKRGRQWRQCTATAPLIMGLRAGSLDFTPDVGVMIHARIVQPVLDVTLVFLGLPLVMRDARRQVVLAAAKSLLAVIGFGLVVLVSHGLGIQCFISPALAAWAPLIVLIPCAFLMSRPLRS